MVGLVSECQKVTNYLLPHPQRKLPTDKETSSPYHEEFDEGKVSKVSDVFLYHLLRRGPRDFPNGSVRSWNGK